MSKSGFKSLMYLTARSIIARLRRPRKSNFSSPIFSTSSLSSMDTGTEPSPLAWYIGQKSVIFPGAIRTPPACMLIFRVNPSSFLARVQSSRSSSSVSNRSRSRGSSLIASSSEQCFPGAVGISLEIPSQNMYGKSRARPTSRTTALAVIVPKVAICETASEPYFWRTYSITR